MAATENYTKPDLTPHHHVPNRHNVRHRCISSADDEKEDEDLDPRIQTELEKLNRASEDINRLEMELDDARAAFRQVLSDSTQCLNTMAKKLGSCVDKARPYYDARVKLKEAHLESQKAVLRFERSRSLHEAAREMVQLAEQGYKRREKDLDPTWQEMMNLAAMKVNDAEKEKLESEKFHQKITLVYKRCQEDVQRLYKDLKKVITKSKPYFELKERFNQVMEDRKNCVRRLEDEVSTAKAFYSQALRNLESISDSIHQHRLKLLHKSQLGIREAGVGAEAPHPSPPTWGKGMMIDGSASPHLVDGDVESNLVDMRRESGMSETDQLKLSRFDGLLNSGPAFLSTVSQTTKDGIVGICQTGPNLSHLTQSSDQVWPAQISYIQLQTMPSYQTGKMSLAPAVTEKAEACRSSPGRHDHLQPHSHPYSCGELMDTRPQQSISSGFSMRFSLPETPPEKTAQLNKSSVISRPQEPGNISVVPHQQQDFDSCRSFSERESYLLSLSKSEPPMSLSADVQSSMTVLGLLPTADVNKDSCHQSSTLCQQNLLPPAVTATFCQQTTFPPAFIAESYHKDKDSITANATKNVIFNPTSFQKNITPSGMIQQQLSPQFGSRPTQSRLSKLQGLILQVNPVGASQSSVHGSAFSRSHQPPKVVISTQHPMLGVFSEKPTWPYPALERQEN